MMFGSSSRCCGTLAAAIVGLLAATQAGAQPAAGAPILLPSGQAITPTAAPGSVWQDLNPGLPDHPRYRAGQAIKTAVSPDGATLLVLTSGFNNLDYATSPNLGGFEPSASNEYVFVYDLTGEAAAHPKLRQVIPIADTFEGLAFAPDGSSFYVSGGADDAVYAYGLKGAGWALAATIPLGHTPTAAQAKLSGGANAGGLGFFQGPSAAGLAVSADGGTLAVANIYNQSVSLVSTAAHTVTAEYDLRPFHTSGAAGQGVAGGETPFAVAIAGNTRLYVSSIRDREVVVLDITGGVPKFLARIPMDGSPNSLAFDDPARPARLYVAQDNADAVAVIDLATNRVIERIDAIAPPGLLPAGHRYTGAGTNNLAVAPGGHVLYVTNGGQNAVAAVALDGPAPHHVTGLIPTGWSPQAVSTSRDGGVLYIANAKGLAGPNPGHLSGSIAMVQGSAPGAAERAAASDQYVLQLEKGGLLSMKVPQAAALASLTAQVARNNHYGASQDAASQARMMAALADRISHVIYIIKENRTFDQVLGDLHNGANADPALAIFGRRITPNLHQAAEGFVTLDNFFDAGAVSGNGWAWSTAARETDLGAKQIPLNYASSPQPNAINRGTRGAPYNAEGQNNGVDVGIPTTEARQAAQPAYGQITGAFPGGTANFFPGTHNDAAPDGPDGEAQAGYLWDSALRAGLSVRNYGDFVDLGGSYAFTAAPYADNRVQAYATNPTLLPRTDSYFRGFDNSYPDLWRVAEWQREFRQYVINGDLPGLTLLRLAHDHMGDFDAAGSKRTKLDLPEAQQADNDLAVGKVLETLAGSPYAGNTLVFVLEDDAQDGPDHVDAHRSTAYVVGPYVRQHAVIRTRYTTVNVIRTIEDILRIDHLNINDAHAQPMADVFDLGQTSWQFTAVASPFLRGTADALPGIRFADGEPAIPVRLAAWWARQTNGFDWSSEDRVPATLFNHIIWTGFRGAAPYPTGRGVGFRARQQR